MARRKRIMKIRVFLQSELLADVEVIEIDSSAGVNGIRAAALQLIKEPHDAKELLLFVEDDDNEDALNLKAIPDGLRVHLHRLKAIDVTVRYVGKEVKRTFRPSATIARIKRWAGKDFGILPSDAAELMLQISGSDTRPDLDVHVGSLLKKPAHAICFDLVPAPRVNG